MKNEWTIRATWVAAGCALALFGSVRASAGGTEIATVSEGQTVTASLFGEELNRNDRLAAFMPVDGGTDGGPIEAAPQNAESESIGAKTIGVCAEWRSKAANGEPLAFELLSGPGVLDGDVLAFTEPGIVVIRARPTGDETGKEASATRSLCMTSTALHRYAIVPFTNGWLAAKADAESRGGHLATIASAEEWTVITNKFGSKLLGCWLGGTDAASEGNWQWVTGEPWTFSWWGRGEPNGRTHQNYLWIHTGSTAAFNWDDSQSPYYEVVGYLLEFEEPELTGSPAVAAPVIDLAGGTEFEGNLYRVSISCTTGGAVVRYTLDGSEPGEGSSVYAGSFNVFDTTTVKARAFAEGMRPSAVASARIVRLRTLSEAIDQPLWNVATDGAAPWTVVSENAHDGVYAARSGKIGNNRTTRMTATVEGAGTLSFWWRVACEDDPSQYAEWDHAAFSVDGTEAARMDGDSGWVRFEKTLVGEGAHTLEWTYQKDRVDESVTEDAMWVDEVVWEPTVVERVADE